MGRPSVRTAAGLALAGALLAMPANAAQEGGAEKTAVADAPGATVILIGGERWRGLHGFKGHGFHGRHGLHRFGGRSFHPFKGHAFGRHRFHTFKRPGFHSFNRHGIHRFDGHGIHVFKGFGLRSFPRHRHKHHRPSIGARIFFFGAPSHGFKGIVVRPFRGHDRSPGEHYRRGYGER